MTAHIEAVAPALPAVTSHPAPPCAVVIFGATGDLTHRKLIPAIFSLWQGGALPEQFVIAGIGRRDQTAETYRADLGAAVREFGRRKPADDAEWARFAAMIEYIEGDFHDAGFHARLKTRLDQLDASRGLAGNRLFYLATSADEFGTILHRLKAAGLIRDPRDPSFTRVIVEKPFGSDLESARVLNSVVANVLDESQTFRIDHYLGKETVQNILVFRFANSIFEPMWNRKYVDHVQITAAETVGVGTRGAFYEKTGVLRDIVQNHLLEVLSLIAMEPPTTSNADDIRSEKLKVIHALREPWADTIDRDFVLGQYRGYRAEPNVASDSVTPTFAALRVFVDNWRWQGVPFYLRAGKAMAKRVTEVSLYMQDIPLSLFGRPNVCENLEPNVLTLRIQPDEGIELSFASKIPGHDLAVGSVKMDMRYVEAFGGEPPEAYERLLLDAMRGDATLFSRRDAVEASWGWITPVLRHFEQQPPRDFPDYEPSSWGPPEAEQLLLRDRRAWRSL